MAEFWTTEQVAEHLDMTVGQVYESRKRKEWPGIVGTQRGRRLLYRSDLIEAGPQEPDTTNDPQTAIIWALGGIKKTLDAIHNELRVQRVQYVGLETIETTIETEGEEE